MNCEKSKTSETHRFRLDLTDKLDFKDLQKNMALANLSIYYTWKTIKSECTNNKVKISAPTWNDTFDLLDGSYSISDIQDYFEFIIKKHETLTEIPLVQLDWNKIKNRTVDAWNNEIVRKWGKNVDQDKGGGNVPKLESVEVALVHCNLVKSDYQHTSKVLFTFVTNKQFGQLINISPRYLTMMNTINTEFSFAEVSFTAQVSKVLEIKDSVNLTIIIG